MPISSPSFQNKNKLKDSNKKLDAPRSIFTTYKKSDFGRGDEKLITLVVQAQREKNKRKNNFDQ